MHDEAEAARQQAAAVAREMGAPHAAMDVFDRDLKRAHRARAAALRSAAAAAAAVDASSSSSTSSSSPSGGPSDDPLLALVADRLLDRLEDCVAKFPTAVVLGGAGEHVIERLRGGRAGVERVIHIDTAPEMLAAAAARRRALEAAERARGVPFPKAWPQVHAVVGDEEHLPLAPGSVDVVIACLGLHWANDLPVSATTHATAALCVVRVRLSNACCCLLSVPERDRQHNAPAVRGAFHKRGGRAPTDPRPCAPLSLGNISAAQRRPRRSNTARGEQWEALRAHRPTPLQSRAQYNNIPF